MSGIDWNRHTVTQCANLHPYIPGKPVEQLLREKGLSAAVKLASNENPYGPSPSAVAAIRDFASEIHRYPDGDSGELKAALAARHAIKSNQILLGNGSNEVLEIIIRTFAGAGDDVVYSARGFIVYALAARAAGANGIAVPEADGLTHDLDAMLAAVQAKTKVICIANPNNPTGSLLNIEDLQAFLDALPRRMIVILDEAYYEYVRGEIGESIGVLQHPGLIVCRTFSKAYGLAGLRVGYAVGDDEVLSLVNRFREPFNVNLLAQKAALAALNDANWVAGKVAESLQQRQRLEVFLAESGLLGAASHANFVLLRHVQAAEIARQLENSGIIPRPLAPYGMPEWLRISVGTADENRQFMTAMQDILKVLSRQTA
ncbi:MAG: histidinol-phosphate transaminase [Mariprofundaceae bacterium]